MLTTALYGCVSGDSPGDTASESEKQNGSLSSAFPYTFKDSNGVSVTLNEKPKKVAVLFSSYADIWTTAGGNVDITVGESIERGFANADAVLVDSGSGHTAIDLETLVAEQPDLVIGTADYECQVSAVEFCRSVGIPSALFKVESFREYLCFLEISCNITGDSEAYRTFGSAVKDKIDLMLEKLSEKYSNKDPAKVLFVRAGSSARATKAKTSDDNFVCAMLKEIGTENIADTDGALTGTLSLEAIVAGNPEYMFITTMGNENAAKEYMNSQLSSDGWKDIDCVKNSKYTYLPKDLFHYKPNSRWAEAYEYLIKLLHPDFEY